MLVFGREPPKGLYLVVSTYIEMCPKKGRPNFSQVTEVSLLVPEILKATFMLFKFARKSLRVAYQSTSSVQMVI